MLRMLWTLRLINQSVAISLCMLVQQWPIKLPTVATSSTEAEFIAAIYTAKAVKHL